MDEHPPTNLRRDRTRRNLALLAWAITGLATATILGAWAFEWAGYPPCELCLKERIPYYIGIPLGVIVAVLASRGHGGLLPGGFGALALVFAAGAVLATYHAGVEWHLWSGPASCTGSFVAPAKIEDFLHQLQTTNVVRCDAAALRILGVSLAGWDALVCAGLAVLAVAGVIWSRQAVAERTSVSG